MKLTKTTWAMMRPRDDAGCFEPGGLDRPPILERVFRELREGASLTAICRADDMPSIGCVLRWIGEDPNAQAQYRAARDAQADVLADRVLDLSVQAVEGRVEPSVLREVGRQLQWFVSVTAPRRYGKTAEISHRHEHRVPIDPERLARANRRLAEHYQERPEMRIVNGTAETVPHEPKAGRTGRFGHYHHAKTEERDPKP